ncbi:unnamed protein product [Paramecium primaurelia]|uniref:Uncharacterized protein n=1 Tax=Paramecium primaurelia TaxID=5886 RepID=A0A8S1P1Q4_PARPR|nr:unnamed protein product [Paramecium primaurelia]
MGIPCSKQQPKPTNLTVHQSNDFQILLAQPSHVQQEPEEEIQEPKQTKIDVAQNSIDLNKKRYSSKDVSVISKYIENELKNQSMKIERLTIDMRDASASCKGGGIVQRKEISIEQFNDEESNICNTVYTNPKYKRLKSMNEHSMILLHLNENKQYSELLYRVINDYHFRIEHESEFNNILMRSQDSFLQNLLISDKYINEYGIFHIFRETIKFSKLDLILQNDFTLNSTQLHYNKLFVEISYFPLILATSHIQMFCLYFTQFNVQFKNLTNSNFELMNFLNQIKQLLKFQISILSICEQNNQIILNILIDHNSMRKTQIISHINNSLNQQFGFIKCSTQPLVKYIGCELNDIDAWNNREFKEDTKTDSQFSTQFGWKLFGLNIKQINIKNIGYIYYNLNQNYNENVRIYSLNEVNRYLAEFEMIEIKVYCEKKYYKMLFQITYNDEDIIIKQNQAYLTTLLNSRLTGIMIYDAEKQMKY